MMPFCHEQVPRETDGLGAEPFAIPDNEKVGMQPCRCSHSWHVGG